MFVIVSCLAIFLDRDGVINYPVFNPKTNEFEAPHNETDFKLFDGVINSLKLLQKLSFKLFLVSNQPDYAKGKTTLENLYAVHKRMDNIFRQSNITFSEYYYCYHHPKGIVPGYSIICECRKPGNLFLRQAQLKYGLDLINSWMIGDRDMDIMCAQSLGLKSILIKSDSSGSLSKSRPDFKAGSLVEAVEIISKSNKGV